MRPAASISPRSAFAALALAMLPALTHAAGPTAKGQAPGWYRMPLGDFEITALSDGTVDLPVDKLLTNSTPATVQAALMRAYLKVPVETSVNGYLVNTGSKLVLIDAGAAGLFGPTLGKLVANLKASGYTARAGRRDLRHPPARRPRGRHHRRRRQGRIPQRVGARSTRKESGFWLDQPTMDKAPAGDEGRLQGRAWLSMKPYVDAGKRQDLRRRHRAGARHSRRCRPRPHAGPHHLRHREQRRRRWWCGAT